MTANKSIGKRIALVLAAIALGIAVQVIGASVTLMTGITAIEYIIGLLGFVVMGVCIYKWAVK
jgi:hypothetical protein